MDGERIVAGWIALTGTRRAEGFDVTVASDMLEAFKAKLEAHRADRALIQRIVAERALGRAPLPRSNGTLYVQREGSGDE